MPFPLLAPCIPHIVQQKHSCNDSDLAPRLSNQSIRTRLDRTRLLLRIDAPQSTPRLVLPPRSIDAIAQLSIAQSRAHQLQEFEDLLVPQPVAPPLSELEVWIQQCAGRVQIDEADTDMLQKREERQSCNGAGGESFESVDEWHVRDARAISNDTARLVGGEELASLSIQCGDLPSAARLDYDLDGP